MQSLQASQPGGPDILRLVEAPKLEPQAGQVLVRVAYATLNPLDVFIRQGRVAWLNGAWPFVPGLEFSGRVEAVGPGVDPQWRGRAVLSLSEFGGCADYAVVPVARLEPLDEKLGWPVATAWRTPTLGAWFAIQQALRLQKGETILIHSAAGPLAIMAAQIANDLGATTLGLAGGAAKLDFARRHGFDQAFDYRLPDWPQQVLAATGGTGVNAIIDGNGGATALRNYEVLAPQGRLLYVGATSGSVGPDVPVAVLVGKSFSVGGFNLNSIPDATVQAAIPMLAEKLARQSWRFPLGETVELRDVADLHARFEARQLMGRSVIRVGGDL